MMVHPNAPEYVGIEFKVWAPQLTRVTKKLYLLGSLKELGAWNIDKALKAFPTADMHVWTVEASLPSMSHFEWVWLTTNLNRGDVKWERSIKRNRTIDCFSGTLHTIWGEGDEVFLQAATCLEVTTFLRVDDGFTLVLTGSTPSAGEWNLHHAKPATEFPKRSGYWKIHMAFDAMTNLEFKWAVVKDKDHGVLRMQEKLPHSIFGRRSWMRAVAPWNAPIVVVVDTPLLCDLPDTMRGRTDVIVKARQKRAEEIKTWLLQADSAKASPASAKHPSRVPPSPLERPASMSLVGLEAPIVGVASGIIATPTFSLSSVIARQKTPDPDGRCDQPQVDFLDNYVKDRDDAAKTEKMAIQMYRKYSEETAVHAIKGKGQKIVPTDKMNIGDFDIEENMGSLKMYGEVAEITAKHVSLPANTPQHTAKSSSMDKHELRHNDKASTHTHNRSLTKVIRHEETSLPMEGEWTPVKVSVCLDNDINEEGVGVANCVTPLQVLSQTVPEATPSDTGFNEMSSCVSSVKTDATNSESALISSQTMTYVLAAEVNNMSDGEDSRSDPVNLELPRLDHTNEGMVSFWELQQRNLTPPWLDEANGFLQGGSGDLVADNLAAWNDDEEHLEWLASRIEEEDEEEEDEDMHFNYTQFRSDFDDNPDYSEVNNKATPDNEITDLTLDFSADEKKGFASSPPKSLRKHLSPRKFIQVKEEQHWKDENKQTSTASFPDFEHLYDSDLTPYASITMDSDDVGVAQRRLFARTLEEQWGASYRASEGSPVKHALQLNQPPTTDLENKYSVFNAFAEGTRGLVSLEGKPCRMAYYSLDELSDMFLPDADFVNHREKAHELEIMWGESQNKIVHVK